VWDLGTMPCGPTMTAKRLLHLTPSRRPDFIPTTVADQLGASLVAQTQTTIGEVLNAIQRKCLLDLMAAWTRLLKINGIEPSHQRRTAIRRDWFWGECFDAIVMAMCRCETEHAAARWHVADMLIRGEAAYAAIHASRSLLTYEGNPEVKDVADMLRQNLAAYTAFSEGR
jgi:hypothetical protein